jgi:N-acetyl-1-D-myo-inositol-2-amino-2-deoxy-alpha-D-glucopyranoside deacetylase
MDQRMLLVHAHPDDETIQQGATMAKYAARGTQVTLVTCTLGEEGEVLVPELEHLASHREDKLGQHRIAELANAMKVLGVTDHRFLGKAGKYRDSGMVWHEEGHAIAGEDVKEGTFWRADLLEAAADLVDVIREVRPQVLVTYDQFGGYGHPDHIQAHRVAMYGASLAAVRSFRPELGEPWDVSKIYWGAMSENRMREGLRRLRASGDTTTFEGMDPEGPMGPFVTPDHLLDAVVDGREFVDAKMEAMKAHATQITVDGPFFALSNNVGNEVWAMEYFSLARGERGPVNEDGLETDLFAGLG